MKKITLFGLLGVYFLGLFACSREDVRNTSLAISENTESEVNEIIPNVETPEKRAIFEEYKRGLRSQKGEMRSIDVEVNPYFPPIDPMESVQKSLLAANLISMDGEVYYISPVTDENLFLYSEGPGLLSGFSTVDKKHTSSIRAKYAIKAVSSLTGFTNSIRSLQGDDCYLTTGTVKDDDIAYVKRPGEDFSGLGWGAGWNIYPRGKGIYTIQSAFAYRRNGDVLLRDRLVMEKKRPQNAKTRFGDKLCCLSSEDTKNKNQSMVIIPESNYTFKGIRFFSSLTDLRAELYKSDMDYNHEFVIASCDIKEVAKPTIISSGETFTSVREYTNNTNADVEYDMYFDDKCEVYSHFNEYSGLKFSWDRGKVIVPYIKDGKFYSSGIAKFRFAYSGKNDYTQKTLEGMLPLVISPKTHVKLVYTYRKYRVTLPYIIYLESQDVKNESQKYVQGKIVGLWTGDVVAEDLSSLHHYERKKINDPGEEDDEYEFGDIDYDDLMFDGAYHRPVSRGAISEFRSATNTRVRYRNRNIRIRL